MRGVWLRLRTKLEEPSPYWLTRFVFLRSYRWLD